MLVLPVVARLRRIVRDRRWCLWRVPWCLSVCGRPRMGRNAWCSALASRVHGCWHHEKRGSVDRARGWCFLSARSPGGARGTDCGVTGAFLGLRVSVGGAGWVGMHGVPCWVAAFIPSRSSRNVGVAIGLVLGAPCRCIGPEERLRPSVVSLARSWDSECLWAAPDGSESMVFRVGCRLSPSAAPRETWEWR